MVLGPASRPAALLTEALTSPGTLYSVVLFTVVAMAELMLNQSIFLCPCDGSLALVYGMSFLVVPALILFMADFPWKLVRVCPSPSLLCSLSRRPIGLAMTWIVIGLLQRRYVLCMLGESKAGDCERSVTSTWLQLMALYFWMLVIICTLALVLCRRVNAACMKERAAAEELETCYQMKERRERTEMEKKIKYGNADTMEEDVSHEALCRIQSGLTPQTYQVLRSEQLLKPSVLRFLRPEDLQSVDISVAQRCLLRHVLDRTQQDPNLWNPHSPTEASTGRDTHDACLA